MIRYLDTRGAIDAPRTFTEAILEGIAPGGGLFVPERLPAFSVEQIALLAHGARTTRGRRRSTRPSASTSTPPSRGRSRRAAYGANFDDPEVAPVREVAPGRHVLELWHGPTLAFKDMALQCMPLYFARRSSRRTPGARPPRLPHPGRDQRRHRRGGAQRLRRSRPHPHLRLLSATPASPALQELQMVTQPGDNLTVFRLGGDFDDCQSSVKAVFDDAAFAAELAERHGLRSRARPTPSTGAGCCRRSSTT